MAGSGRLTFKFFMLFPILVGISLLSCVLVMETRASALPADPPAASDLFTQPGMIESGAGNDTILSSSAVTDTINIFLPYIQRNFPTACGEILTDTIWVAVDGPYKVICDVYVESGVTLTIEAGVTVRFQHHEDSIVIYGALWAEGTGQDPVLFQAANGENPGSWRSIVFAYGSSGVLNHTFLEYG
jgi:hypothetical protein